MGGYAYTAKNTDGIDPSDDPEDPDPENEGVDWPTGWVFPPVYNPDTGWNNTPNPPPVPGPGDDIDEWDVPDGGYEDDDESGDELAWPPDWPYTIGGEEGADDYTVTVTLDSAEYETDDTVNIDIAFTNNDDDPATDLVGFPAVLCAIYIDADGTYGERVDIKLSDYMDDYGEAAYFVITEHDDGTVGIPTADGTLDAMFDLDQAKAGKDLLIICFTLATSPALLGYKRADLVLPTFTIAGQVYGDLLDSVDIDVTGDDTGSYQTDVNGVFVTDAFEPGDYVVTPSAFGITFDPDHRDVAITDANVTDKLFTGTVDVLAASGIIGTVAAPPDNYAICSVDSAVINGASSGTNYTGETMRVRVKVGETYKNVKKLIGDSWSEYIEFTASDLGGSDYGLDTEAFYAEFAPDDHGEDATVEVSFPDYTYIETATFDDSVAYVSGVYSVVGYYGAVNALWAVDAEDYPTLRTEVNAATDKATGPSILGAYAGVGLSNASGNRRGNLTRYGAKISNSVGKTQMTLTIPTLFTNQARDLKVLRTTSDITTWSEVLSGTLIGTITPDNTTQYLVDSSLPAGGGALYYWVVAACDLAGSGYPDESVDGGLHWSQGKISGIVGA